jgi:hypothetical protein
MAGLVVAVIAASIGALRGPKVVQYRNISVHEKLPLLLDCLDSCRDLKYDHVLSTFVTDIAELRAHYLDVLDATEKYRPRIIGIKRKDIPEHLPMAEEFFMHHFVGKPYDLFAPLVPIFVQWNKELRRSAVEDLQYSLQRVLRPDVLYFTVASELPIFPTGFNLIVASSNGLLGRNNAAHMILPHFFHRYQAPGFDQSGLPLWNKNKLRVNVQKHRALPRQYVPDLKPGINEDDDPQPLIDVLRQKLGTTSLWEFHNFKKFLERMQKVVGRGGKPLPALEGWKTPPIKRMRFVGNASLTVLRRAMVVYLHAAFKNDFSFKAYDQHLCPDTSVPKWGVGKCGRVDMLAADVDICPVGSDPVSYELFEALQMGQVPFHISDDRGKFLPYKGTAAEVRTGGLGFAGSFDDMQTVATKIMKMTKKDFRKMRADIMAFRTSHYTPAGLMQQLEGWFSSPVALPTVGNGRSSSDLRCCANPKGALTFEGALSRADPKFSPRPTLYPTKRPTNSGKCAIVQLCAIRSHEMNESSHMLTSPSLPNCWQIPRVPRRLNFTACSSSLGIQTRRLYHNRQCRRRWQ